MDEAELNQVEAKLKKEGYPKTAVGRFKGLGEMEPIELWETTLNPDTRRLLPVRWPVEIHPQVKEAFDNMMRGDRTEWRKEWLGRRGHEFA